MTFVDDLQHAYRRLRSRPAMMLAAASMLALGVGLTTGMFTVIDALMLRPAPFRDPDRSSVPGRPSGALAWVSPWRSASPRSRRIATNPSSTSRSSSAAATWT
jgi:hypothetical protein